MLVEKYRPRSLDEIIGHKRIVESMRSYVRTKQMPNILLVGKSGTGKTAMAYALRYELGCGNDFLELNASDQRGIETVRTTIKNFARQQKFNPDAPFKLLLLDEADAMTKDAQNALRRTMEQYWKNCRMILTINTLGKLIPALRSRCAVYHMRGLMPSQVKSLLQRVSRKELGADQFISDFTLDAITKVVKGDCRLALNTLEAILHLENPTAEDVFRIVGEIEPHHVFELIHQMAKGEVKALDTMNTLVNRDGASSSAILNQIYYSVLRNKVPGLSEEKRLRVLANLSLPYTTNDIKLASFISRVIIDAQSSD